MAVGSSQAYSRRQPPRQPLSGEQLCRRLHCLLSPLPAAPARPRLAEMLPPLRKAPGALRAAALAGAEARAVADAADTATAATPGATVVVKPRRRRSLRHVAAPCLR